VEDYKRLHEHLTNNYNKLVRPAKYDAQVITVDIDLKLTRLIDIDEKNQISILYLILYYILVYYIFLYQNSDYGRHVNSSKA